jgi:nucleotide-binding universal stress UspA family protein
VDELHSELTVETEVPVGDVVAILGAASRDLDLLVCGSRGHGPLGEVVLGSTSHALLGAAACPLLLVPRTVGDGSPQARESQSRSLSA